MRNLFAILTVLFLCACDAPEMPSPYHAIDVTWQHAGADFHLTDFRGTPRSLADFKGKVVVLFFGYTHCPDVCPTTLADLAQVLHQLGKDAARVQVLFITLDPERDKPELLAQYVPYFDPAFLGLYGDSSSTYLAAKAFGVNYVKHSDQHGGYTLDHSDGIYLLGPRGKPLLLAPYSQSADKMVHDIRLLLSIGR